MPGLPVDRFGERPLLQQLETRDGSVRMRAAVLSESGLPAPYGESRPLAVEEVTLDDPGPGEVLLRIVAAGLCHSDLSAVAGTRPRRLPAVAGHEGVGVVEALGPHVESLSVGDHVVTVFVAGCGRCTDCRSGRPNLCELSWRAREAGTLLGGHRRLHRKGTPLHHWSGVSAFAEYAVVAEQTAVRIAPDVDLRDVAMLGCAALTGVGAVFYAARVTPGQSVAVIGLGGVGLSAVMGAKAAGATRIVAIDLAANKLALAEELGATQTIDASMMPDTASAAMELAGQVDVAFDMAGGAGTAASAYELARRGGTVVIAGLPAPDAVFPLPIARHVADEKRLVGSYMGSTVPHRDIPRLVELYRAGRLPLDRLRSSTLTLDGINDGLDRMRMGDSVRDIVDMER